MTSSQSGWDTAFSVVLAPFASARDPWHSLGQMRLEHAGEQAVKHPIWGPDCEPIDTS
jgi:hypothetical protein